MVRLGDPGLRGQALRARRWLVVLAGLAATLPLIAGVATFTALPARADIVAWLGAEDPRPGEQATLSGTSCRPEDAAEMELSLYPASLEPPPSSALVPVDLEYGGMDPEDGDHIFVFTIPDVSPGPYLGQYRCGPGDEWKGAGAGDGVFEILPRDGSAPSPGVPNTDTESSTGTGRPWPPVHLLLTLAAAAACSVVIARRRQQGAS